MSPSAFGLNCTLTASPAASSTQLLLDQVLAALAEHGVSTDSTRVVDHDIKPGVRADEGDGDEWPGIRKRVLDAGILVTWAFTVAASTFCPLLVLGIWWRGLTDVGAISGLLTGFVASGIGPFTGQYVHFKTYAPEKIAYAMDRYEFEALRHWGIVDARLARNKYVVGT